MAFVIAGGAHGTGASRARGETPPRKENLLGRGANATQHFRHLLSEWCKARWRGGKLSRDVRVAPAAGGGRSVVIHVRVLHLIHLCKNYLLSSPFSTGAGFSILSTKMWVGRGVLRFPKKRFRTPRHHWGDGL